MIEYVMKRVDFANGKILQNILQTMLPMLVAQVLNLLYNIVDRIYIARIPEIGTAALGAVGLCFPLIILITAFTNLFGMGGAPLFSIERGKKNDAKAAEYMNTAFFLLVSTAVVLTIVGESIARPVLSVFGKKDLPDYQCSDYHDCPLCRAGQPIDGLVNAFGISIL